MNFKEFADRCREPVYKKICEYIRIKEPVGHYKIMRDYIDRQGKYRRPGLLLLTANMYGATMEEAILPAAAMQLSEDWILMQDDWEDDSELRRGQPAAHRIYGPVHTVNATNTGQMAMWKMLKDYIIQAGLPTGGAVYDKFYQMLEYTVEGQYVENHFIHDIKDLSKADADLYFRIAKGKTCFYTIYGPMQLGALTRGARPADLEKLKEIGEAAGIAFQIVDDILDMTADEKEFGKRTMGDLYEGKMTLIALHAYESATRSEKDRMDDIYRKSRAEKKDTDIAFLKEMVEKYDCIPYARGIAEEYGKTAKAAVEKYAASMPKNEYSEILISAIEEMYTRKK